MTYIEIPEAVIGTTTRDQHRDYHNLSRHVFNSAIYSHPYTTLQDALDAAAEAKRPLIIAPGLHTLTSPLLLNNLHDVHVYADDVILRAGANLSALLEFRDCVGCFWKGGRLDIPEGRTVDNALYVYRGTIQSTDNSFQHIQIEGHYTTGIRIGEQGNGAQCDHTFFSRMHLRGRGNVGQVGIHAGDGVFGNNLNHTFNNVMLSNHDTHVVIDATNTYWTGVFMDTANLDFDMTSATILSVRGVRSEGAKQFLVTGGPAGYAASVTIKDVDWHAEDMEGSWIHYRVACYLGLEAVRVVGAETPPVITADPSAALVIRADGLKTTATYAEAFDLNGNATVQLGSYFQLDESGSVGTVTTTPL